MRERILDFIESYRAERGYPPTWKEIGDGVGLSSTATVHHYLLALRAEGRVDWTSDSPRTLRRTTT